MRRRQSAKACVAAACSTCENPTSQYCLPQAGARRSIVKPAASATRVHGLRSAECNHPQPRSREQPRHIACPGPTADPPGRLKHYRGEPARRQPARRGNTRSAGSDNDYVGVSGHGSQGRMSKRRLVIRPASGCFRARPSHGRKSTHSSERPCSSFHLSSRRLTSRPRRAIQPKYRIKVEGTGTLLAPICPGRRERHMVGHERARASRAPRLDRQRRPPGQHGDDPSRDLRPGGRGRTSARARDRDHRHAPSHSTRASVSLGAREARSGVGRIRVEQRGRAGRALAKEPALPGLGTGDLLRRRRHA